MNPFENLAALGDSYIVSKINIIKNYIYMK